MIRGDSSADYRLFGMKVFEVIGTNHRVGVDVDSEFFEKEVDVRVELGFTALAEKYQDLATILGEMLKRRGY